jgi:hypothetical protein
LATIWPSLPLNGTPRDHLDRQRHRLNSAVASSTGTAIGATTVTTDSVTGTVRLVTEQVDVEEVKTETATAGAAHAALTALAAVAATALAAVAHAALAAAAAAAGAMDAEQ